MNVNNTQSPGALNSGWINLLVILIMIAAVTLTRLIPHPSNFTAVGATALFAGFYFSKRGMALLVPVLALLFSDLLIGFHSTMFYVYAAVILSALLSFQFLKENSLLKTGLFSLGSSVIFFVVTNLGVWAQGSMYSMDLQGLIKCFVMAIPFFKNQILGDLVYTALFFAVWEFARRQKFSQKTI